MPRARSAAVLRDVSLLKSSVSRSIDDFHFRKSLAFRPSMITKQPRRQSGLLRKLITSAKTLLIIEGVLLLGSYGFWRCLNTSQDFRYYIRQHFPSILEGYYAIGEKLSGNDHLRAFDHKTWTEDRNEH